MEESRLAATIDRNLPYFWSSFCKEEHEAEIVQ